MKIFKLNPKQADPTNPKRTAQRYAYFPTRLDNGDVIWFEKYVVDEHFRFFKKKWVTYAKRPLSTRARRLMAAAQLRENA